MRESYDLILGGTGFASTFFLLKFLERKPNARVLVLERGHRHDYSWMLENKVQTSVNSQELFRVSGLHNKNWLFTVGMGGGSACWWGQTPRFLPEDFALKSRYGVGHDWPIGYSDLEAYYDEAERLIGVAGPSEVPYPKSGAYPQPAHHLTTFDRRMIDLVGPQRWIAAPTARSSTGTSNRGKCCANGVCGLCPVDAKFRVMNEFRTLYDKANISLRTEAELRTVDLEAGRARGVVWLEDGVEHSADGDLIVLGLNAFFNPTVLQRSGDDHPLLGRRLHEQMGVKLEVDLANIQNFDGGTHITGLGYMFYSGEHRSRRAACLVEHQNSPPLLRTEKGKWRQRALLKLVFENLPEDDNTVSLRGEKVVAHFRDHSDYAKRAMNEVQGELEKMLEPLGLDSINFGGVEASEGHIQGTAVMAARPDQGVVDDTLVHHRYRNLVVAGSSCFPSGPPANPSLTIAALSLRAADKLMA